jgi:hypothetical protein
VVAHGKPLFISKDFPIEHAKSLVRDDLNRIRDAAAHALQEAPSYTSSFLSDFLAPAAVLAAGILTMWRWLAMKR